MFKLAEFLACKQEVQGHTLPVQPHLKLDLTWVFISDVSSGNKALTYKVLFLCKAWQLGSVRATDTRQRIQDVVGKLGGPFMLTQPPKFKTSSRSTGDRILFALFVVMAFVLLVFSW